jgi:ATP-dependent protease HslVU (ClpYQ) peptidase subunit
VGSDEIYHVVKEYLLSRNDGWRFILGGTVYDARSLIEKMERDKKFRKYIIDEVIKTAVDLLMPKR